MLKYWELEMRIALSPQLKMPSSVWNSVDAVWITLLFA